MLIPLVEIRCHTLVLTTLPEREPPPGSGLLRADRKSLREPLLIPRALSREEKLDSREDRVLSVLLLEEVEELSELEALSWESRLCRSEAMSGW